MVRQGARKESATGAAGSAHAHADTIPDRELVGGAVGGRGCLRGVTRAEDDAFGRTGEAAVVVVEAAACVDTLAVLMFSRVVSLLDMRFCLFCACRCVRSVEEDGTVAALNKSSGEAMHPLMVLMVRLG